MPQSGRKPVSFRTGGGEARRGPAQVVIWCVIVIASLALSVGAYDSFQLGVYRDDATYVVLARSLVEADRYGLINNPGAPAPTRYPFAYPLLLAPYAVACPDSPEIMKTLSLIATLLNAAILFWGWRSFSRSTSYWWGLGVVALYSISPLTVEHTRMVMSEPVFTTWCLLALVLLRRYDRGPVGWIWTLSMGTTLAFLLFTRTIGAVLVAASCIYLIVGHGSAVWRRLACCLAISALLVGLCVLLTPVELSSLLPTEYARQFTGTGPWRLDPADSMAFSRLAHSIALYGGSYLGQLVLAVGEGGRAEALFDSIGMADLADLVGPLTAAMVILGFVVWGFRERWSAALLFAVLYCTALLVWPSRHERFLYPIQQQIFFGFLLGLYASAGTLTRLFRSGRSSKFAPAFTVVALLTLVFYLAFRSTEIEDTRLHVGDLRQRTRWIEATTPSAAIVMTEHPQIDFLYGKRRTVPLVDSPSRQAFGERLVEERIDYVLIAPEHRWSPVHEPVYSSRSRALMGFLEEPALAHRARLVHAENQTLVRVYAVDPSGASHP